MQQEPETGKLEEIASQIQQRPQPWEEIEQGRFMPRRIRGSCVGRELG